VNNVELTMPSTKTEHKTIYIKGMIGPQCANVVEWSLKSVKGVTPVTMNFADARADVDYDPELVTAEALEDAIRTSGYIVFRK